MIPLKTLGRWLRPGLLLSLLVMLTGCDAVAILSPKGQIGQDEKTLLITATVLMLLVVIPVIIAPPTPRPATSRSGPTRRRSRWWCGRSRA